MLLPWLITRTLHTSIIFIEIYLNMEKSPKPGSMTKQ